MLVHHTDIIIINITMNVCQCDELEILVIVLMNEVLLLWIFFKKCCFPPLWQADSSINYHYSPSIFWACLLHIQIRTYLSWKNLTKRHKFHVHHTHSHTQPPPPFWPHQPPRWVTFREESMLEQRLPQRIVGNRGGSNESPPDGLLPGIATHLWLLSSRCCGNSSAWWEKILFSKREVCSWARVFMCVILKHSKTVDLDTQQRGGLSQCGP